MEETKKLLQKKVSFQESAWAVLGDELSIGEILSDIKKKKHHHHISTLRRFLDNGEKQKYDMYKKKLPGVTFCGTFNEKRKREYLKNYNELIVIDIDKLDSEKLAEVKKALERDKYVFTFWESPSKNGVKGLMKIKYNYSYQELGVIFAHKYAFKKLIGYFFDNYSIELDESGSDTTRLCFLSSDENLVLKDTYKNFEIDEISDNTLPIKNKAEKEAKVKTIREVSLKNVLYNPAGKNLPRNRATIRSIIKYLTKRKLSITDNYENWYRVAFAIANSFTHDIGEKYFLRLCRLDGGKHNEIESKNLLNYCYENSRGDIKFSTIVYYAKNKGYVLKNNGGSTEGASPEY